MKLRGGFVGSTHENAKEELDSDGGWRRECGRGRELNYVGEEKLLSSRVHCLRSISTLALSVFNRGWNAESVCGMF